MLDSVRSLLPAVAAAAEDVDRTAAVDPRIIADLHEAGYFALLKPVAFGGLDADLDDYLTATRELASACMSTGWLAGWLAVNNWGLTVRNEQVLEDIWGSDPRALLCSSYAPTGRLESVAGGYRLSGRWTRCSGAPHATWLSVAALRVGPDGEAQDFMAVLLPRADYTIERTWNGLGLRGIGADDAVVTNAFIPEHRAFSWLNLDFDGVPPLDRIPQPAMFTLAGTLPLLGAAQRLLDAREPEPIDPLDAIALSRNDVELSIRQVQRNMSEMVGCIRAGGYPDAALMLRTRRDQVMASERAARAVETVVVNPGHDIDDRMLERVSRDVQTARTHVSSNVAQVLSVAGKFELGLSVDHLMW